MSKLGLEFSNRFDVVFDSITSNKGPEIDSYEKSLFLTEAQKQIVVELYSGRNERGASFEATEELRSTLRNLIKEAHLTSMVVSKNKSKLYNLPKDCLFITNEEAVIDDEGAGCLDKTSIGAIPITHDEISKALRNPFRKPSEDRVLRIDIGSNVIEVYSLYNIGSYNIKYIKKPVPIIVKDLDEGLTIDGLSEVSDCELDSSLYEIIINRAVRLAAMSLNLWPK